MTTSGFKLSYESLDIVYHIIGYGLGFPAIAMICLIIFLILNHTPKEMKLYSRLLLHSTVWELIAVVYVCVLSQPVFLYPHNGVVINGPIRLLGYPVAWASQVISILLYGQGLVAVTACFVYRYQKVTSDIRQRGVSWRPMFALILYWLIGHTSLILCSVQMYAESYDEEVTKQEVLQLRPDWSAIATKTVVGMRKSNVAALFNGIVGILAVINSLLCVVLFALILHWLKKINMRVTEKVTHKNLTIAIMIQILTPICCILIPLSISSQINNDLLSAIAVSGTVWYHLVNGFATLYFVKPYGQAIIEYRNRVLQLFRLRRNSNTDFGEARTLPDYGRRRTLHM